MNAPYDAVLVLGKELRADPERARKELRARAAAAAAAVREGASFVATLEAKLRGQDQSGSALVAEYLAEFGVPKSQIVLGCLTRSTREEAMLGTSIFVERGVRRGLVLTAEYHVARARHLFSESLSPVEVHAPSAVWRWATPAERLAITEGIPTAAARRAEAKAERLLGTLETVLFPLPLGLRSMVEVKVGAIWRGTQDRRAV